MSKYRNSNTGGVLGETNMKFLQTQRGLNHLWRSRDYFRYVNERDWKVAKKVINNWLELWYIDVISVFVTPFSDKHINREYAITNSIDPSMILLKYSKIPSTTVLEKKTSGWPWDIVQQPTVKFKYLLEKHGCACKW